MDGYYPGIMEELYDWEREKAEDIIWDAFNNKKEIELAQFLPRLEKYDGIRESLFITNTKRGKCKNWKNIV